MNPQKANGMEGQGGRIFKDCAEQLGNIMARILMLLIGTGLVPIIWRTPTIILITKKKTKNKKLEKCMSFDPLPSYQAQQMY